jgi:hypothetical protein
MKEDFAPFFCDVNVKNMDPFENSHRMGDDKCVEQIRKQENDSIRNYNLALLQPRDRMAHSSDKCGTIFSDAHRYSTLQNGYGIEKNCIDNDSHARINEDGFQGRGKCILNSRVFQGVPNMNSGGLIVDLEDRLKQGHYNDIKKSCDSLAGVTIDRFVPLVCGLQNIQNPENIVMPKDLVWQDTRDIVNQEKFIKNHMFGKCIVNGPLR